MGTRSIALVPPPPIDTSEGLGMSKISMECFTVLVSPQEPPKIADYSRLKNSNLGEISWRVRAGSFGERNSYQVEWHFLKPRNLHGESGKEGGALGKRKRDPRTEMGRVRGWQDSELGMLSRGSSYNVLTSWMPLH